MKMRDPCSVLEAMAGSAIAHEATGTVLMRRRIHFHTNFWSRNPSCGRRVLVTHRLKPYPYGT